MSERVSRALSEVLDGLEASINGEEVRVQHIVQALGQKSFASLLLIFPLIAVSPASAVPGVTATVAVIVFLLVSQMIIGRESVWLPSFIRDRRISKAVMCKGIAWLRKPIAFVERFLKARLTFILERPWRYLPLGMVLALSLFMPFLEFIPTSGSIASAIIAVFAAGLLTRDGVLVLISLLTMLALPALAWQAGVGG